MLHNLPLKLDLSYLLDRAPRQNFTYRDYNLDIFNLEVKIADNQEIEKFLLLQNKKLKYEILFNAINPFKKYKYFKEKSFLFDKNVFQYYPNIYLDGYWQSEKYFLDIKEVITSNFQLKLQLLSDREKDWLDKVQKSTSVCLHIRRGDLVSNSAANQFHGVICLEYIYKAIEIIASKIKTPTFFIFSDDMNWCKTNIKIDYQIYFIDHFNPVDMFPIDFQLMTNCQHFIISNSTFSWWAAWLSQYRDKIVIAPQNWFRASEINTKDLVPDSWIRI